MLRNPNSTAANPGRFICRSTPGCITMLGRIVSTTLAVLLMATACTQAGIVEGFAEPFREIEVASGAESGLITENPSS